MSRTIQQKIFSVCLSYLPALREYWLAKRQQKKTETKKPEPSLEAKPSSSVIGKTSIVYLEDPARVAVAPAFSVPLETTGYISEEEDVSPDEVESELTPPLEKVLDKEELYEWLDENAPGKTPNSLPD